MQHADPDGAGGQLDGVVAAAERGKADLRVRTDAHDVTVVELDLGARVVAGPNRIADQQRSVYTGRNGVARVAALHRHVTVERADESHAGVAGIRANRSRCEGQQRRRKRGQANEGPVNVRHGPYVPKAGRFSRLGGLGVRGGQLEVGIRDGFGDALSGDRERVCMIAKLNGADVGGEEPVTSPVEGRSQFGNLMHGGS